MKPKIACLAHSIIYIGALFAHKYKAILFMQITDATDGKRENDFLTKVDEGELSPVER